MISELNLAILQRYILKIDENYDTLIFCAKYTSVYFQDDKKWNNMDIYGTFVLYTTNNNEIILRIFNKKRLKDFFLVLDLEYSFELKNELLIIKKADKTYGIWFHNKEDLETAYKKITGHKK